MCCAATLCLLLAGCTSTATSVAAPTQSPTPTSTTPTPTPTPTTATDTVAFSALAVGDCLTAPAGSAQTEPATIVVVPCSSPHSSEVFAFPQLQDGAYPGDESVTEQAFDTCSNDFASYVGVVTEDTELDVTIYTPSQDEWNAGTRTAACVVFYPASDTIGSAKGLGTRAPQVAG